MYDITALIDLLRDRRVFIQTHNYPDPDAVASAYGLRELLRYYGIESTACYRGRTDTISTVALLQYLPFTLENAEETAFSSSDVIILVDGQKYNANLTDFPGEEVACIDHHPDNHKAALPYEDIRAAGACATLIAQYFIEGGVPMTPVTATALLFGIAKDTGNLMRGVTDLDIDMFSALFKEADRYAYQTLQANTMHQSDLAAYSDAISNVQLRDRVGFSYIAFDCPDGLIAMIAEFILAIDAVDFSVVYSCRPDGLKFSVRSLVPEKKAGQIVCRALDGVGSGGGHDTMAAGFARREQVDSLLPDVKGYFEKRFYEAFQEA